MNEESISTYIKTALPNVQETIANGDRFFFHGSDHKMPFATLVTKDDYDTVSNLSREGVFRLNIGVSKETYQSLFGNPPTGPIGAAVFHTPYDFAALDTLLPNPIYAQMFWICILNPTDETFEKIMGLLAEAHSIAMKMAEKREK